MLFPALLLGGCSLLYSGDDLRGDGRSDAGPADAAPVDAGPGDAGPDDAGPPDAGPDADSPDAGPPCVLDGGIDEDGDGFCLPEDCDDTRELVFPGAFRICGDGVVNDCNARGPMGPEPADTQRLTALLGEVVPSIATSTVAFSGDSEGTFAAALAAPDDSTPPVLAVLASQMDSIGYELLIGPVDEVPAVNELSSTACFPAGQGPNRVAIAASGPGTFRMAFARTLFGGTGNEPWLLHGTADYDASTITDFGGGCQMTSTLIDVQAVGALRGGAGEAVPAMFGTLRADSNRPCIAVGTRGCAGLSDDTSTGHGVGLGGMMLGAVTASGNTVVRASEVNGRVAEFTSFGSLQLTGRVDATHEGADAVMVAPSDDHLLIARQRCSDAECSALDPIAATLTDVPGRLALTEPRLSVTPLGWDRFLIAHRGPTGTGIALTLFDNTNALAPIVSPVTVLEGLRFDPDTLFNFEIVSAPDGNRQIFVILATTGEDNAQPDTLHRFHFSACRGT